MMFRTPRERILQTCLFELGGLAVVTPAHALLFNAHPAESLALVALLSAVTLIWSPLHNAAFDRLEWRLAGRLASDRPQRLRLLHAISHEGSLTLISLPLIMALTGLPFVPALVMDLWFALAYVLWAWAFFLIWDRARPLVQP
jgi:uncharacterized membrane protein